MDQLQLAKVGGSRYAPATSTAQQPLTKTDKLGSMFMSTEDSVTMKQVLATHNPDAFSSHDIDVRPILQIAEDILNRSTLQVEATVPGVLAQQVESLEEKSPQASAFAILEAIAPLIDRISCEMSCKCMTGSDGHQTTLSLFTIMSNYSWDAKLVLTLAAFALNYGEFWLLAQIYSTNQLAKSMAILKQLPAILEHSGSLKPRFDALNNLIKAILELTRCIVAFKNLPSIYITQEVPALSAAMATIPAAVHWAVRAIVACACQIISLTSQGHEYFGSTAEAWELSSSAQKIRNIHEHLKKQLEICYQIIEDKRNNEAYETLLRIFEMIHIDNMKVLKALIYAKDDVLPLYDGSAKRKVSLEALRRKNVLLLISNLDISQDELSILEQIYTESRQHATRLDSLYEIVWMPIVDPSVPWTDPLQKKFDDLQATMAWYTVAHPKMIELPVIRFVRDRWHFRNKPILVVLDPQGRVLSPNAIHMMWIWGSNAFPFTSAREEALWKEETWKLELLVNGIDPIILNWIREGKYIFLYGGDDLDWIRRFTTTARAVARSAGIQLEMAYVGKSNKKEQIRRTINAITAEKLSSTWQELMIWFFWTRLESMLFSKLQLGRADDVDPMMQEIKKLLSFDKSGGWAVLSRGSEVVVNGHSAPMLLTVLEYDAWKENVPIKGFDQSLKDHYEMHHSAGRPCCRFEFLSTGKIPESLKCPECHNLMEKYISFLCCHDEDAFVALYQPTTI